MGPRKRRKDVYAMVAACLVSVSEIFVVLRFVLAMPLVGKVRVAVEVVLVATEYVKER